MITEPYVEITEKVIDLNQKKVCPLLSITAVCGHADCIEVKCAWWREQYKRCVITALPEVIR